MFDLEIEECLPVAGATRRSLHSVGGLRPRRMSNRIRPRPETSNQRRLPTLRWQVAFPAILAVVAALLGAVAGGLIAASASEDIKSREIQEQRADEARKVRGDVYLAFLGTADNVDKARFVLWLCYVKANAELLPTAGQCHGQSETANETIQDLIKKQDALVIYGSSGAVQLAQEILEGNAIFIDKTGIWESDASQYRAGGLPTRYPGLRSAFQKQMCQDLNPLPRSDC